MKQITVNGSTYQSVAAAWREESPEGLKLTTVRWRLRQGWSNDEAFLEEWVPPVLRRLFKGIRVAKGAK